MDLLEKQLFQKKSVIPCAGKGLFTKVFIPKETRIVEYKGVVCSWKDVKNTDDNAYLYYVNSKHVIDAKPCINFVARYANDARGMQQVKGILNNCRFIKDGVRVFIQSTKDIEKNSEILVGYGKEYWDAVRYNRSTQAVMIKLTGSRDHELKI